MGQSLPMEFVILPLFSTQPSRTKKVAPKSGINQWNAAGRPRKFGEAYIPVPKSVHKLRPGFFPDHKVPFNLHLPNGQIVSASICQQGGKALMSNPNDILCKWLFSTIDGNWSTALTRYSEARPYIFDDLMAISMDAVKVTRGQESGDYYLEPAPLGSYEQFVQSTPTA